MTSTLTLKDQLREIIAEHLRVSTTDLQDDVLLESTGLDSLAVAEIVVAAEQRLVRPIDTARLSTRLTYQTTLGEFVDALAATVS